MSVLERAFVQSMMGYGDSEQEKIDFLISWAQQRAENYIGRSLESESRTVYLDGDGGQSIFLPVFPVTAITSIYLDSTRVFATALSASSYYCKQDIGVVYLSGVCTPDVFGSIKVVYTAGYTSDTLPADLKGALLELISYNFGRMVNHAFGISTQSSPDGMSVNWEPEFPSSTKRILDSYKTVRV